MDGGGPHLERTTWRGEWEVSVARHARPTASTGERWASRRVSMQRRSLHAAERAARDAGLADDQAFRIPWSLLRWVAARVCALALLLAAARLLYGMASSQLFDIGTVRVTGNTLLNQADVERVTSVTGANAFWVDSRTVADRLRALPLVQSADVTVVLPATIDVRLTERRPIALWVTPDQTYLVDAQGVLLTGVSSDDGTVSCPTGPCAISGASALPSVKEVDGAGIQVGDHVDPQILTTSMQLAQTLPGIGLHPTEFDWSASDGLVVVSEEVPQVRFDPRSDLSAQLAAAQSVRDYLARTGGHATLIDVRFSNHPYYR